MLSYPEWQLFKIFAKNRTVRSRETSYRSLPSDYHRRQKDVVISSFERVALRSLIWAKPLWAN